jgi:head-tail adaptor
MVPQQVSFASAMMKSDLGQKKKVVTSEERGQEVKAWYSEQKGHADSQGTIDPQA